MSTVSEVAQRMEVEGRYWDVSRVITSLHPYYYSIEMGVDGLMDVVVRFRACVTARTNKESVADFLRRLALWLHDGKGVDIVKSVEGRARCFYCASLNEADALACSQCGASF